MPQRANGTTVDFTLTGVVANITATIPAGYAIRDIFVQETAGNAVTGGINVGTTAFGVDVALAFAVAGNSFGPLGTAILKRAFSAASAQTLYISAVTGWNAANLSVVITMDRAIP